VRTDKLRNMKVAKQAISDLSPGLGATYWRLWTATGLSGLADGVVKVALPLVAVQYTHSPTLIAGLAVALTLPWLLFSLPAGALADRLDRRRIMLVANGIRAGVLAALVLAVTVGAGSLWVLYVAALCVGTAETLYDTTAQSIVPQTVGPALLARANGRLYAVELTANQFVGPPLAGVLTVAGVAVAIGAPLVLWLAAVGVLTLVRGVYRAERAAPATMRADIAAGLRFLWRHRLLRTLAAIVGVFNLATSATSAVLVLYALGPMGLSEQGYGILLTATAAGSLLGSFVAEWMARVCGRVRSLTLAILAGAMLVGAPAVTANPFLVGAAAFVGGVGVVVWNVISVSLRQRITPNELMGRVNSAYRLLAWGIMPVGAAAGGLLADWLGLRTVFLIMGMAVLVLLPFTARLQLTEV